MAAVIVHGGAWAIPDSLAGASTEGCEQAAVKAHGVLLAGKSALDAGKIKYFTLPTVAIAIAITNL